MNQYFVYHPYKSYRYILPMTIGFCALGFIVVGMNLFQDIDFTIFGFVIGLSSLLFTIYCANRTNTVVVFDADGVRITMGTRKYYQFVSWDSLKYAYPAKNIKGFQFLILSPKPLHQDKINWHVREGTNGNTLYSDSVLAIQLWPAKEADKVEKIVTQHGLIKPGEGLREP